jgi:hypothetical protein
MDTLVKNHLAEIATCLDFWQFVQEYCMFLNTLVNNKHDETPNESKR